MSEFKAQSQERSCACVKCGSANTCYTGQEVKALKKGGVQYSLIAYHCDDCGKHFGREEPTKLSA